MSGQGVAGIVLMTEEIIKYKERMGQLKSFRQLFIGKHTPSDIDLAYEIGGRVFVFGELKLAGVDVPTGQKLLLQHIGEALFEAGKNVLLFIAEHDTEADEIINVGELPVVCICGTRMAVRSKQCRM